MSIRSAAATAAAIAIQATFPSAASFAEPAYNTHAAASVVLNELAPAGPWGPMDEFLELRNTGTARVNLTGWSLAVCDRSGPVTVATFAFGFTLAAGGRLVLAGPDYSGSSARVRYNFDVPSNGGWQLSNPAGQVIDSVGLGYNACTENRPAGQCAWSLGKAAARIPSIKDSGDNAADFACQTRTPGS